jgi:hypothetical protein
MVDVIVCQRYPAKSSTLFECRCETLNVLGKHWPWIDNPSRIVSDYPAVGARHRQRTWILGAQPQDAD